MLTSLDDITGPFWSAQYDSDQKIRSETRWQCIDCPVASEMTSNYFDAYFYYNLLLAFQANGIKWFAVS